MPESILSPAESMSLALDWTALILRRGHWRSWSTLTSSRPRVDSTTAASELESLRIELEVQVSGISLAVPLRLSAELSTPARVVLSELYCPDGKVLATLGARYVSPSLLGPAADQSAMHADLCRRILETCTYLVDAWSLRDYHQRAVTGMEG